jgi:hypothetical protein
MKSRRWPKTRDGSASIPMIKQRGLLLHLQRRLQQQPFWL